MLAQNRFSGTALRRWNAYAEAVLRQLFPRRLNLHTPTDPVTLETVLTWRRMMNEGKSPPRGTSWQD